MKIAIIQFSDIHISSERDFVISRLKHIVSAIKPITNECVKIIIAITGDIANTGSAEEYTIAEQFLRNITSGILSENRYTKNVDYVIVPGNHDCYFAASEEKTRIALINESIKDSKTIDEGICSILLNAQNQFWNFYSKLTGCIPKNKISYRIERPIDESFAVTFLCYNTSLMSRLTEIVGGLMIPEDKFITTSEKHQNDIVISLFHHNTGWLSPATNNKKQFEKHVFESSNIVMCGHEHDKKKLVESSLESDEKIIYLESPAFQNNNKSEFYVNVVDTENYELEHHTLTYHDSTDPRQRLYKESSVVTPISKQVKGLTISKTFEEKLLKLPIPINHPIVGSIKLNDCYVFPDLEPQMTSSDEYGIYVDSQDLISRINRNALVYVIEGASRSGKSSLLKTYFLKIINTGVYPIFLNGEDIEDLRSMPKYIKKAYESQYDVGKRTYDFYHQLDNKDKIVLIDDLSKSLLSRNSESVSKLYGYLAEHFGCIIVTVEDNADIENLLAKSEITDKIKQYRLLSLGSFKRSRLIERWLRLGRNVETIDIKELEHEIKVLFDTIKSILGDQFMSPYPFFLLSLLQSMNDAKQIDLHQTYYAYCYQSLLIAIMKSLKLEDNKQKQLLSFLDELAYKIFTKKELKPRLTKKEFDNIFIDYKSRFYISYNYPEECLNDLERASIVEEYDNYLRFSSKYIYYYLAAEKLSEKVTDKEGKEMVDYLCCNLHNEECANVLVFLVYHTKDINMLETLLVASSLPFERCNPVSLQTNDTVFGSINGIIDNVKQKVLVKDVDPKKEREKELKNEEKVERVRNKKKQEEDPVEQLKEIEKDPLRTELITALQAIRILGQIVKNENSRIEKEKIIQILEQTYITCFRIIGAFVLDLKSNSDDIVKHIVDESKAKGIKVDDIQIRDQIGKLIGFLIYKFCLYNFSNLTHSVGTKDLDETYDDVAEKIGTPAARLVSFTIKSYYGKRMNLTELEDLYQSFSSNPVAQQILRARAIHYVYHNTVGRKEKQKIGSICKLKLIDRADMNKGRR